ncbi:MAG TPA: LysR family transcriptional regulator substrate-binding protein, partial [Patescibacteria group bacterium]|nr:LysR family transcriptional regulator substrate-binding protein [Patescibacteria group bacterium]
EVICNNLIFLKLVIDECSKHEFMPNIVLSSDQIETMKAAVKKNVGICFLIEEIARNCDGIASIPLTDPLYIEFGLAWKKDKYLSKAMQAFISYITKVGFSNPVRKRQNKLRHKSCPIDKFD